MELTLWTRLRIALMRSALTRTKYIVKHHIFAEVGENFFFQPRIIPINAKYIKFHNNVAVASNVTFVNHDVMQKVFNNLGGGGVKKKYGCIEVMDNVFIGCNSTILCNTKIGPNAIIAAGSVVTRDVPQGVVVGGVPAKIIGDFDAIYHTRLRESLEDAIDYYDVKACWRDFDEKHGKESKLN